MEELIGGGEILARAPARPLLAPKILAAAAVAVAVAVAAAVPAAAAAAAVQEDVAPT